MKIFGKTLKEYIWPIKFYIIGTVLVVISQYFIASPLRDQYPLLGNVTQAFWALLVALSTVKLVREYDFNFKNVLFLGVLYSFIIHGLKAFFFRVFLFPYQPFTIETFPQYFTGILLGKFLYGSFLVMIIVIIIGVVFIYAKKKKIL